MTDQYADNQPASEKDDLFSVENARLHLGHLKLQKVFDLVTLKMPKTP